MLSRVARRSAVLGYRIFSVPVAPTIPVTSSFSPQYRFYAGHAAPPPNLGVAEGVHFIPREEVQARVLKIVSEFDKVTKEVTATSHFTNDLGLDSLDVVEVVMALEQEFSVDMSNQDAEAIHSVADAIDYFAAHPSSL
eukprot:NODE_2446_length_694_cov_132.537984_g1995_i0.p1 GENE.NODE_2446_length_694_cov_132.537984_g1995_i0~~NODE_2446_length_694_cov_132.537984_g1995_i0.p1  ORF type:complete len:158 (+),score=39.81 NODE_2446_length_694_cov_132.537984_g1995_i0:63-476(+)